MNRAVGVIGAGHWGKNLIRVLHELGALSAVADTDEHTAEEAIRAKQDISVLTPAAMLADPAIRAVVVATPPATHGTLARAALEAGKDVFVEKPLCLDVREGHALAAFARKRGCLLMVGHLLLYHPAFVALREFAESGALGTLRYVYSNRLSLGRIRREENALWSFAPHDVSMILQLAGGLPKHVTTTGAAYINPAIADTTLAQFEFADGIRAHIFVSWLHPYKEHRLVLVGSEGMAVFDDVAEGAAKLLHFPHRVDMSETPTVHRAESIPIPYGSDEPLVAELQHFLDRLEDRASPRSDAVEGLRVLTVLDACQRSLMSGSAISLDRSSP